MELGQTGSVGSEWIAGGWVESSLINDIHDEVIPMGTRYGVLR